MSQENVDQGEHPGVLVWYRVFGGPVAVDQRLTVFEDGAVELDERHRTRDPIWLRIDPTELDGLRSALEELPSRRWSHPARVALARLRARWLRQLFWHLRDTQVTCFLLRRGRHAIFGVLEDVGFGDRELNSLLERLDPIRVRALCEEPRGP
jgi:hypothetical protein